MSAQTCTPQAPAPSTSADSASPPNNGRDSAGRFAKGNPGGPGNPHARHTAMLRKALAECISEDDIMDLGRSLYLAARNGDWVAAKLLLSYVIGKPAPPPDPDTLEEHEWKVFKALPVNGEDVSALLGGLQAKLANQLARDALPLLEVEHAKLMAETFRTGKVPPLPQETPRPAKEANPDRPSNGANGPNGPRPNGPNGSNGPRAAAGRPPTGANGSNGKRKKKRSKWWGFGQPFRPTDNGANGQKSS
jgi:hypothetical protein